nr:unnamed protein product [Spirometra erinaceieuropaei]
MHKAVIPPTLLSRAGTCMVYKKHTRSLNPFHLGRLQDMPKLRWQDRIPDTVILERTASLERLQIYETNCEDLAPDRPTWKRTVTTGTAIYVVNRIAAARAKREARKSQLPPTLDPNAQPSPTCPRCQRTFRETIGLTEHLRTECAVNSAASTSFPSLTPAVNPAPTVVHTVAAPPPLSTDTTRPAPTAASIAGTTTTTTTTTTPTTITTTTTTTITTTTTTTTPTTITTTTTTTITTTTTTTTTNTTTTTTTTDGTTPDVLFISNTTKIPTSSDVDSDHTCSEWSRTFTSHIDLVGHL